jgi:para-nitrobenzyl esterase
VTIFGESAGGHNVAALIASSLAEGLFHRAIIQSGSLESVPWSEAAGETGDQFNPAMEIAAEMVSGPVTAEALRSASLEAVFTPFTSESPEGLVRLPTVIADGVSLPEDGIRAAYSRRGGFNAVPIITGTNRDEMKLFNFLNPDLVEQSFFGLHYAARDPDYYQALSDYQGRQWRIGSVDEAAALLAEGGHDQVYAYRFDWDDGGSLLFSDIEFLLGAGHAVEIPFVFNRFEMFGPLDNALFRAENAEDRAALAQAMGAYWGGFAADGAPGGAGLPDWPVYGEGALMRLDSPEGGGPELIRGVDSAEKLAADLAAEPRLNSENRCKIAFAVDAFRGPQGESYAQRLDCGRP